MFMTNEILNYLPHYKNSFPWEKPPVNQFNYDKEKQRMNLTLRKLYIYV